MSNWNQVRSGFPDRPLRLYGPDTDSGTFDYFTEEINGEAQASRSDYTASADDNGNGCIIPSPETIADGSYTPLSRPLFIYINVASLERPEVMAFVNYYMEVGAKLTDEVGYVAADSSIYEANLAAIK